METGDIPRRLFNANDSTLRAVIRIVASPGPAHKEFIPVRLLAGREQDVHAQLHGVDQAADLRLSIEGLAPAIIEIGAVRLIVSDREVAQNVSFGDFAALSRVTNGICVATATDCARFLTVAGSLILSLHGDALRARGRLTAIVFRLRVMPLNADDLWQSDVIELALRHLRPRLGWREAPQ